MKKVLFIIFFLTGFYGSFLSFSQTNIHIKLADTVALETIQKVDQTLSWERIFPYTKAHEQRHQENGLHLWYKTKVEDSAYAENLVNIFKQTQGVEKATIGKKAQKMEKPEIITVSPSYLKSERQLPVNDPLYPKQWNFHNTIYPNGIDINLEKAWNLEQGSRDVIVAIMDTPFDPQHEDYIDNVWINEKELNGKPGVDDDENGYIDDVYGYSYMPFEQVQKHLADHGTHVAGAIAAINNNEKGVSGIAGGNGKTNGVKLMRCHVMSDDMRPSNDDEIAKAYVYAADHGAVISQNSWTTEESEIVTEGINYFMKNAGNYEGSPMKGGLVVWAASNSNSPTICQPISDPLINRDNLIVVASVGPDGSRASYSNYGDWVNVAAPGGELNKQGVLSTITNNRYGYMRGTSMACPQVSGVAALIVSKFKGNITPNEVKHRILTSVNDVNKQIEGQESWHLMGSGIVDAWKALVDNTEQAPNPVSDLWISKASSQLVELSWKIPEDADDHAIDSCTIYYSNSPITEINESVHQVKLHTAAYAAGDTMLYRLKTPKANETYYFKISCQDRWKHTSTLSETISCKTDKDIPLICGDYLFNRFNLYQPASHKLNRDSLSLQYTIYAPKQMEIGYKINDPGKAISVVSFENNHLNLFLKVTDQKPQVYDAEIIAFNKKDDSLTDTLRFTYQIKGALDFPVKAPQLRPGKSLEFIVEQKKGSLTIDLSEYIEDPYEMGVFFTYDTINNRIVSDYSHGRYAQLTGNKIKVDYEYSDEILEWSTEKETIEVPIKAMNYECSINDFDILIMYPVPTSIEQVEDADTQLYPNPIENVLNIQSSEQISQVYIYAIDGFMVYQKKNPGTVLDLSHLSSGNYIIQMMTPTKTIVRKIIKK